MPSYAHHVSTRRTPQSEPIPGSQQVENSAGGYSFAIDIWQQLDRFVILGSSGGTYYATERTLTKENAEVIRKCAMRDPHRTVARVAEISVAGRAPKNDEAIFALAILVSMPETRPIALEQLPQVCRIGTHLFDFMENLKHLSGMNRSIRRALSRWYTEQNPRDLSYGLAKYQSRNGWSHRDVLRKCHAKSENEAINLALGWAAGKRELFGPDVVDELKPIAAMEAARRANTDQEVVRLIRDHGLVRECIPTEFMNSVAVWDALLERMPLGAMVRNLGKMSAVGLLKPMSKACRTVSERLVDRGRIKGSRLHPISVLLASRVYGSGRGVRGSLTWTTDSAILEALDDTFYLAFDNVEPTGKRYLLGLDVSSSMTYNFTGNRTLNCREAAAAMAMVAVRSEPMVHTMAFTGHMTPLTLTKRMSINDAVKETSNLTFGRTDCAQPMMYALEQKIETDVFVIYTDNETWCGSIHPVQALREYRDKMGIPAKLIVAAFTSSRFSIADPEDPGMLDVVGFSSDVPAVMSEFVKM